MFLLVFFLWALVGLERVEGLVGVPNEGQAHFRFLLVGHGARLGPMDSARVLLRDLVDREVRYIDVGAQPGFEGRTDVAQLLPDHAAEEGVVLDLRGAAILAAIVANSVVGVAQETNSLAISSNKKGERKKERKYRCDTIPLALTTLCQGTFPAWK